MIYMFIYLVIHLHHAGYRNQYSDQASDWIIGVRIPVESRNFVLFQNAHSGPGSTKPPAQCVRGFLYPECKAARA